MRKDIEFKTEDGTTLRGWHYTPDRAKGPFATIVMCHGFSAVKEIYLDKYAEVFADAGLAALVYDHRNFGDSDGALRGDIDPWQQISDFRDAITFAETLPETDASRIGVWGSSYAGGHVLVVSALDRRIKAAVSQVPLISGPKNMRRIMRADTIKDFHAACADDRRRRYRGEPPAMIKVVAEEPGEVAALPTQDSIDFMLATQKLRAPKWVNLITLRSVEKFTEYDPGAYISHISPTPLLMVVAPEDHLAVGDLALEAYERALHPKKLVTVPGGHFEAYVEAFSISSGAAAGWFKLHLLEGGGATAAERSTSR